jgi:hypothetical protein
MGASFNVTVRNNLYEMIGDLAIVDTSISRIEEVGKLLANSMKQPMKQPMSFGGEKGEFTLKNYQIFGVGWLVSLYKELGIGGILADEMVSFSTIILGIGENLYSHWVSMSSV